MKRLGRALDVGYPLFLLTLIFYHVHQTFQMPWTPWYLVYPATIVLWSWMFIRMVPTMVCRAWGWDGFHVEPVPFPLADPEEREYNLVYALKQLDRPWD